MKKYSLIYLFLFSYITHAQSVTDKLYFEDAVGTGIENKGITPLDLSFKAHIDITSKIYVFASTETNFSYYKENAIETYGKGQVVVVSHRLSTVKNANQIIVLDGGTIVEISNHNSLIKNKGVYYNLVKIQLELGI